VTGPPGSRPVEVSASHGDALGAVAVALPPLVVGVDVERRRPEVEWAGLLPGPVAGEPTDPFERWTRLEAAAKAAGTGIVTMPRVTGPAADDGWSPTEVPGSAVSWRVRSLDAPDGYAAALAVSRVPPGEVRVRWHR
jgi:hypothetical protein